MAKKGKKSKSPKSMGLSVTGTEGKSTYKRGKESVSSKSNRISPKNKNIETSILNDDLWSCTVLMMVSSIINSSLIEILEELPNTTLINSKLLSQTTAKKEGGSRKSRGSLTTKVSKDSKRTTKKKVVKKKENGTSVINDEEKCKINLEEEKSKLNQSCLSIKRIIVNLRNSDLGLDRSSKKVDKPKHKNKAKIRNSSSPEKTMEGLNTTHRFVILSGFYSLMIPEVMNSLLVPVKALITVKPISSLLNLARQGKNSIDESKADSGIKRKEKSIDNTDDYNLFLNNLGHSKRDLRYLERNKDMLFLNYNLIEDKEDKNIATHWKENMLKILNGIKFGWDEFEKFNDSLDIHEVPLDESLRMEDAKLYNTMISMVPLECVNIPVIIHCMLEQVHDWVEEKDHSTSNSACTLISNINESLDLNKYSHSSFDTTHHFRLHKITNISPIIIKVADRCKYNTFHLNLPEFDFEKITLSLLSSSLVYKLWNSFPMLTPSQIKWNEFNVQRLKKCSIGHNDNHKLYLMHLNHSIMNFFLLRLDEISSESESRNETKLSSDSTISPSIDLKPVDKYSNSFVRRIIGNIIHQVPKKSMELQNISLYYKSMDSDEDKNKSYSIQTENLLHKKLAHKQKKLDLLESFIFHSDLLIEYEGLRIFDKEKSLTDVIKSYELVEELDTTLCQSLNSALQAFENVNFFYSFITDSILLWFNNNMNKSELKTSYNIEASLETPIGFRDFYKFKLGGKTNLIESELNVYNSLFNEGSGSSNKIIDTKPHVVYNLGSLHLGVFESHSRFFSPDSSYVKVKRTNYFNKFKSNVSVSIGKNNTFLTYEFDPEDCKKNIELRMSLHNSAEINCSLSWEPYPTNFQDENFGVGSLTLNLHCILTITLPTGLLIEVIRSDSILGPFYIRQSYLSKGPICGEIWDEKFRCYLKTGTIVIFYYDGSVDILYSNGTKVSQAYFEFKEISNEIDTMRAAKESNISTEQNLDFSTNKNKTKKKDDKKNFSKNVASKKKTMKSPKAEVSDAKPDLVEDSEKQLQPPEMCLYASAHSVVAWDGLCTKYKNNVLEETNKLLSLRMAFDRVNHELYLQRSDKLSTLYTSDNLTVTFPDGSRITSVVEDSKYLSFHDELHIITLEEKTSVLDNYRQSESESSSTEVFSEMSNFGSDPVYKEEPFVFVELSHLAEHSNYASVNFDNWMNEVEILLPDNVEVKIDAQGLFHIEGKDGESLRLKSHSLEFEANVLDNSLQQSKTVLYFENVDTTPTIRCQTEDSFQNIFSVDENGRTNLLQVYWNTYLRDTYNYPRYPQNVERLFVFNRDLTGYELIHKIQLDSVSSAKTLDVIKTSVGSGLSDLFSLYIQSPIYSNRSEQLLMSGENNLPTMIRRKDLIKLDRMPQHIWFLPALSTVMEVQHCKTITSFKTPQAIAIRKLLKIKDGDDGLIVSCYNSLKKYVDIGEEIYRRYRGFYPKDTRMIENHEEEELQREKMFGSSSYYLSDNVKIVLSLEN